MHPSPLLKYLELIEVYRLSGSSNDAFWRKAEVRRTCNIGERVASEATSAIYDAAVTSHRISGSTPGAPAKLFKDQDHRENESGFTGPSAVFLLELEHRRFSGLAAEAVRNIVSTPLRLCFVR